MPELPELLRQYFEYYATKFNFTQDCASIRTGGVFDKMSSWPRPERYRLSVEDPFET